MKDEVCRDGIVTGRHNPDKQGLAISMRRVPTHAEELLWQRLRASQVAGLHFRRQQVIDGFIADFYCHAAALVIEVDGPIHESQTERDADRTAVFKARSLEVLRFTNNDVETRMPRVLAHIAQTARARITGSREVTE